MKTIYKSEQGKEKIINLYDKQLSRLDHPWKDVYVDTSFGRTHIVETGNLSGEPLLVFHGGNATTAYNLLACDFIMNDFHIYAVDMVGHPGKSAQTSLPAKGYAYGKWAGEVIDDLKYDKISLFGGSFGAGVIAKTMCVCPDRVKRVVLYVPSGIKNAPAIKSASMMLPMIAYWVTGKDKWLKKCMLPMAITEDNITDDAYETAKLSIDHIRVKKGMPGDVDGRLMNKCLAPTLVMAAEKDCLFPGKGVIERAKKIIPHCTTYLLEGRSHMNFLTEEEKKMIVDFLLG
ncbi:MAG: alpha/beta hydrolase [Lachnospiraceae bacterium]|nr:alpha/beta hydrolase [Lachnospiraceae bacterium]